MSIKYRDTYAKMRQDNWTDLRINIFNEDDDEYLACILLGEAVVQGLGDHELLTGGASMPEEAKKAWLYNAAVLERHARMIRDYVAMADDELPERKRDSNKMREKYLESLAKQGQEAADLMKEGGDAQ